MSKPETKPHRRLSITRPTLTAETTEVTKVAETALATPPTISENPASVAALPESDPAPEPSVEPTVRVMAYLTSSEAELLDDLWIELRRNSARASKSDILRAALVLAAHRKEELTVTLSNQQNSTVIRQRVSKTIRK